ncbi:MAG TPA: DUF6512 family protein [Pseudoflavonifractor sp.]|nr:DUF6512 family protein [Pseudoflavonifractor sp.]
MKRRPKRTFLVFLVALAAGVALHFVYELLPNVVTALLAPVQESLWEHVKLVYWPLLCAGLFLTRGEGKEAKGPWALAILIAAAGVLGLGYLHHIVLGGEAMAVDVGIYVLMMALAFVLARVLDLPAIRERAEALMLLALALGGALVLFTFLPPDWVLFMDLTRANTWSTIPY